MTETPAIIITYPFPLGVFNGGARSIREIALNIGRRGIPVYLLVVSNNKNSRFPRRPVENELLGYEHDERLASANVTVIRIKPHLIDPFLDGKNVRGEVVKLINKHPVSAVISCFNEGFFLPGLLKEKNIPFTIFAIWQSYEAALNLPSKFRHPFRYIMGIVKRRKLVAMYQSADHHFAISNHTGRELESFLGIDPKKISTTYLGVEPKFSTIDRPKPKKIRRFFFFGRIVQIKGVPDAIEAFKRLKARGYDDWEFYFNGEGDVDMARDLINEAGLEQHIFLIDPSNDKDLLQDLSESDLVILPSYGESFGLSFAESQAAALPVIGYEVGSVPEVVSHGRTGWLAQPGDINQLTDYLVCAIEQPDEVHKMGLAGRERVKKLFTWDKTADTILHGLKKLNRGARKS